MITIRPEQPEDLPAIRRVNALAFGQPTEADLVDRLRRTCDAVVSLVAVAAAEVVGHLLFSPATVEGEAGSLRGMGLAPMAVVPARQGQGIGTALVRHGLALLRERACPFVVVLGHSGYYPRFGFERASRYGIACPWDGVPDEAFMVLPLAPGALDGVRGTARYHPAFDAAL